MQSFLNVVVHLILQQAEQLQAWLMAQLAIVAGSRVETSSCFFVEDPSFGCSVLGCIDACSIN